jgi:molybdopterin/thiamine biosynthesis adenylyltransferase
MQSYVLHHEATKRLITALVLTSGIGGLGAEIAKNTIQTSVHSVIVHDTRRAEPSDLASNCYLSNSLIGQN